MILAEPGEAIGEPAFLWWFAPLRTVGITLSTEVKDVGSSSVLILMAKSSKHWYDASAAVMVARIRLEVFHASPNADRTHPTRKARVARAAFPRGNRYLRVADELNTLFTDEAFMGWFPTHGHPAFPPWRLALVTLLPCAEGLSDRQAADAVRSRIDWKYMLRLALTAPGFDASVLRECRGRRRNLAACPEYPCCRRSGVVARGESP
jgi:transposase